MDTKWEKELPLGFNHQMTQISSYAVKIGGSKRKAKCNILIS